MKRLPLALLILFPLPLLTGCLGGAKTATVSGKVTLQGAPVTGGTVTFLATDGKTGSGAIKGNGTYIATDVPFGELKVAVIPLTGMVVETKAPPGTPVIPANPDQPKPMALPARFAKPETSGLTTTVSAKETTYDIPLKN